MIGASIETTLEMWASSLREVKKRIRPLFAQERAALNAGLFVDGLLGDERRKTGWMRAEAAGDPGPWRQQAVLGRDRWDADALRDLVRDYATEHLADENAVLVIDETGFLKQGKASCGVARQYTGSATATVRVSRRSQMMSPWRQASGVSSAHSDITSSFHCATAWPDRSWISAPAQTASCQRWREIVLPCSIASRRFIAEF